MFFAHGCKYLFNIFVFMHGLAVSIFHYYEMKILFKQLITYTIEVIGTNDPKYINISFSKVFAIL